MEKGADVDEEYLDFSKERSTIDQILLQYSQSISVAKAKKDIMGTLSYIHQKNNIAVGIIKSLNDMIDKLEKSETDSNRLDKYNQLVVIQKLISIEQYMITYNNKTLEKCLILIKKIGNKKIKDEVETSKKIEDHVTKSVLD